MECQIAFQRLKDAITLKLVQRLLKLEFPFEVQIDVLNKALRGVLVYKGHPMAFESRKLDVMEQRYSTHEKEMTVDIHYLETWKHYLMGTNFMVVTNNVVNTFFTTQKKLTAKQAPCQEFLTNFDFVWVLRAGMHNQIVDALSRKKVTEFVGSLSRVVAYFTTRVK